MEVGVWDGNTLLTISLTLFLVKQNLNKISDFLLSKWYIVFLPICQCYLDFYGDHQIKITEKYSTALCYMVSTSGSGDVLSSIWSQFCGEVDMEGGSMVGAGTATADFKVNQAVMKTVRHDPSVESIQLSHGEAVEWNPGFIDAQLHLRNCFLCKACTEYYAYYAKYKDDFFALYSAKDL